MSLFTTIGQLRTPVKAVLGLMVIGVFYGVYLLMPAAKTSTATSAAPSKSSFSITNVFGGGKTPIHVCVNTWGGFAGGQWYNGGFDATENSRFFKEQGIQVQFIKIDDFDVARGAWKSGDCDFVWATVDEFVAEAESLSAEQPKVPFQIDWSRGGDLVLGVRGVNAVNDLRGKRVGVAFGTPSHSLLLWLLNSSGLTEKDVQIISMKGEPDVVAAFKAGTLDAGVMWSPDDADAMQAVPGAHVVVSTKQATDIIADTLLVKASYVAEHRDLVDKLYRGWMIGNATVNTNQQAFQEAVQITATGYGVPPEFMAQAIRNTRLVTHEDNRNFFGLNTAFKGMKADELYTRTGMLYQESGHVTGFPSWRNVVDSSIVASVTDLSGTTHAAEAAVAFAAPTAAVAAAEEVTSKPVTVTFATGSAELDDRNKSIIDKSVANMLRQFKTSYVRIEGNTDSTGNRALNTTLSLRRANSVRDYLSVNYSIDANRLITKGNGPDNPACDETGDTRTPVTLTLEACRAVNRRTDFQVLSAAQ